MQEFTIILMDYDEMNPDDTIGRCCIPVRDMECSKTKEYWLSLDMDSEISDAPEVKAKVAWTACLTSLNSVVHSLQANVIPAAMIHLLLPSVQYRALYQGSKHAGNGPQACCTSQVDRGAG